MMFEVFSWRDVCTKVIPQGTVVCGWRKGRQRRSWNDIKEWSISTLVHGVEDKVWCPTLMTDASMGTRLMTHDRGSLLNE